MYDMDNLGITFYNGKEDLSLTVEIGDYDVWIEF